MAKSTIKILQNVLVTPLFVSKRSLSLIRSMAESGSSILFDSGGYYVQMGKLRYEELYLPLLRTYRANSWASLFTLPDHVPTSRDTPEIVDHKVNDTLNFGTLFFQELPDDLKHKAMPVVQGHTQSQIDRCLSTYIKLGVKQIGFGSFGTSGKNNEINVTTTGSVEMAEYVVDVAHSFGIKVHIFGVGRPALICMIGGIKADSFDSSSWLKAAGFGQVFLPFMRGYNVTYNANTSRIEVGISIDKFKEWVDITRHECDLCRSFANLQENKMYRAVHNLIAVAESVQILNRADYTLIERILQNGSPKYRGEYGKWLRPS